MTENSVSSMLHSLSREVDEASSRLGQSRFAECGCSTDLYGLQKQLDFVREKPLVNVMIRGVQTDEERKPSVEEALCGTDRGIPSFKEG